MTKEDYKKYLDKLYKNQDLEYQVFTKPIVNTSYEIIGIRSPIMKKEAKLISKSNYQDYLKYNEFSSYEEVLLYGLIVSNIKDYDEYKDYLNIYLDKCDSWALIDGVVANSKVINKNLDKNLEYIKELIKSKKEFFVRCGYIMLKTFYIDGIHNKDIYECINMNKIDKYYVNMGIAWLLCDMFIKDFNNTLKYISSSNLSSTIINMTIRKCKDSFRLTDKEKEEISKLKVSS